MNTNLPPEELERRVRTNKKIFKYFIIPVFIIISVVILISVINDNSKQKDPSNIVNVDSLITSIKKDELWKINDVEFKDSILRIAVNPEDDIMINGYYFDKTYGLSNYDNIGEIQIYRKNFKGDLISVFGKTPSKIQEEFTKKYFSNLDGRCKPLSDYIKSKLNDPDSYESVEAKVFFLGDNKFKVVQKFRCKNAFNATITNTTIAILNSEGNILSIEK